MPTALGPFDICSSAFQPKEFPCAENNGKQDVTFRWEKGGIRQWRFMSPPASTHNPSMPPFCEWVIYKLLSSAFKAPSICPHHPLPCPVSPACIMHSVLQRDRLDKGLPNPAPLPPLLCSDCSSCLEYPPFCFLQIQSLFILKVQLKMWYLREPLLITGTSLCLIKDGHKLFAAPSTKRSAPPHSC